MDNWAMATDYLARRIDASKPAGWGIPRPGAAQGQFAGQLQSRV